MRVILSLCLILSLASPATAFMADVVRVVDGDTLKVSTGAAPVTLRLYGVDAPEKSQPHGPQASAWLADLLNGQAVEVDVQDTDKFGRSVAVVKIGGVNVNEALVSEGHAWLYAWYCTASECAQWAEDEETARAAGLGLWADPAPVEPWRWRKGYRTPEKKVNEEGVLSDMNKAANTASKLTRIVRSLMKGW